jgi:ubiquinone/menaquinone biosynthesis C-methylase UbiE
VKAAAAVLAASLALPASAQEPPRADWQHPEDVVRALALKPGQTACDIGTGTGYFALRLAKEVAPGGFVYAVDVEPRILEVVRERMKEGGTRNVTPVLGMYDDPLLPSGLCDLILIVNTYGQLADGPGYLRRLKRSLRGGGRLVDIDFQKKETPVGPATAQRVAREDFLKEAAAAGFTPVAEHTFLPYQYFLVLRAADAH